MLRQNSISVIKAFWQSSDTISFANCSLSKPILSAKVITVAMLEAINIIQKQYPQIKLLIVGDGVQRNNLEKLAKKYNIDQSVSFIGKIPNNEVSTYLMRSDVFIKIMQ